MAVTRGAVLRQLAAMTDAQRESTTTVSALATACRADEATVHSRLAALADCHLARIQTDGRTRITITGEELLALDAGERVIVDPGGTGFIGSQPESEASMETDRR